MKAEVKMKVLVMNCSPVRNGATAEIVNIVMGCLEKRYDVKSICIDDYDIKFCKGCRTCHSTAKCVQKDEVDKIIEQYEWADIVIGTHGTALSTILNFYDSNFGCEDFLRIIDWMPYIIELDFEGDKLIAKQEHCYIEKEFKGKHCISKSLRYRVSTKAVVIL